MSSTGKKTGRKPRGVRKSTTLRTLSDYLDGYEAAAKAIGIPGNSYLALKLAEAHGQALPEFVLEDIRTAELLKKQQEFEMAS